MTGNKRQQDAGPEDKALFKRVLADVKPLKKRPSERYRNTDIDPLQDVAQSARAKKAKAASGRKTGSKSAPVQTQNRAKLQPNRHTELELGGTPNIDRRTADRFRRGKLAIEAHLDLHGMYQDEAHAALNGFIHTSAAIGRRCVVVITGKGSGQNGSGILRRQVPRWLNEPGLRQQILSISQAQIRHGGDGAIYILLRRQR